jgi:hypothetical protein
MFVRKGISSFSLMDKPTISQHQLNPVVGFSYNTLHITPSEKETIAAILGSARKSIG